MYYLLTSNKKAMAIVAKNSLFEALSGALAKEIVFKKYKNKTVVSKYPDMSKVKATEKQKVQRKLMKEANAYASKIRRDAELRAEYEKKLNPGERVYHKAKKEFFEKRKKEL